MAISNCGIAIFHKRNSMMLSLKIKFGRQSVFRPKYTNSIITIPYYFKNSQIVLDYKDDINQYYKFQNASFKIYFF